RSPFSFVIHMTTYVISNAENVPKSVIMIAANDFSFHPFVSNKEITVKSTTVIPHISSKLTFGCATYTSKAYANTIALITKLTIEKNPCIFPIHNKTKIKIKARTLFTYLALSLETNLLTVQTQKFLRRQILHFLFCTLGHMHLKMNIYFLEKQFPLHVSHFSFLPVAVGYEVYLHFDGDLSRLLYFLMLLLLL